MVIIYIYIYIYIYICTHEYTYIQMDVSTVDFFREAKMDFNKWVYESTTFLNMQVEKSHHVHICMHT